MSGSASTILRFAGFDLVARVAVDGLKQSTLITVAWLHGCIGFHFWLRLRSWYGARRRYFLAVRCCCRSWVCWFLRPVIR